MAYNNRNQFNQDWDDNREGYGRNSDYNRGSGSYNRMNYMPDNDENKNYNNDYENNRYGTSGNRGNNNYNEGSFGNRYNSNYRSGNLGNDNNRNNDYNDADYNNIFRTQNQRNDYNRGGYYRGGDTGENYGAVNYRRGNNYNEDRRDWWDKASDEVSSWFGDEEAERRRRMDKRMSGEHRGKGPRNYKRSDERIREDINDRLYDDPYIDASDIDVKIEDDVVVLTGTVDNREQKRRAEDIIERISGVHNVENRLRVNTGSYMNASRNSTSNTTDNTDSLSADRDRSTDLV